MYLNGLSILSVCGCVSSGTCAGLLVGRAAGQTALLQLLFIVQDQLDSLQAVDAAAALRHQLGLKTQHNMLT